jgi:tRNA pseudouridine55 synthase
LLGILLIDKPLGIKSHDVVNEVRRRFGTRRVGHAGTLDPLASGVLVVAVGPATRFLQYLPLEPKVYVATVEFGTSTETYDREGEVVTTRPVPEDLAGALQEALPSFLGLMQQLPPMFSAIKVNGKPLYQMARQGQVVEREPRTVHVSSFDLLDLGETSAVFRIVCSGGTYVRSLANDLGEKMGCGGHLSGLVRNAVGRFGLDSTTPLDRVHPGLLMPLKESLPPMPLVQMDESQTRQIREGRPVRIDCVPDNYLVGLLEPRGAVFSVARLLGNVLQPECVIPEEAVLDAP